MESHSEKSALIANCFCDAIYSIVSAKQNAPQHGGVLPALSDDDIQAAAFRVKADEKIIAGIHQGDNYIMDVIREMVMDRLFASSPDDTMTAWISVFREHMLCNTLEETRERIMDCFDQPSTILDEIDRVMLANASSMSSN